MAMAERTKHRTTIDVKYLTQKGHSVDDLYFVQKLATISFVCALTIIWRNFLSEHITVVRFQVMFPAGSNWRQNQLQNMQGHMRCTMLITCDLHGNYLLLTCYLIFNYSLLTCYLTAIYLLPTCYLLVTYFIPYVGFLSKNRVSVNPGFRIPCDQCSYSSATAQQMKLHIESKHLGIRYPCDQERK